MRAPEIYDEIEFWLVRDYLPEAAQREDQLPTLNAISTRLAPTTAEVLAVPADCTDGFFGAFWRRPHAYLDAAVRRAISGLALLDHNIVSAAMTQLTSDLADGSWHRRYSGLSGMAEIDLGYRLVIAT